MISMASFPFVVADHEPAHCPFRREVVRKVIAIRAPSPASVGPELSRLRVSSASKLNVVERAMNASEHERLQQVIDLAVEARASAYAPYSGFAMGAAVVGVDGRTTRGVLVENVSLGLSMCAERVALFTAVSEGVTPALLAVCAPRTGGELTFPCGACLQVGLEIAGRELLVVAIDPEGEHEQAMLGSLLTRAPKRY